MTPGSNVPLSVPRVTVEVAAPVRLDVSGLLLTADGKVRSDDDFIFYNQPQGPGVSHRSGGGSSPDAITVDTGAVPAGIEKIVVTASLDSGGPFAGTTPTATVRGDDGSVVATFSPTGLGPETALVIVEIYRRAGAWKVRAVGQGYANGLGGIATDFGVNVEEAGRARAARRRALQAERRAGAPAAGRSPAVRAAATHLPPPPSAPPAMPPAPARRAREGQPGQGPGQPAQERDGVAGQGGPPAAVVGPDGPGLGSRPTAAGTSTWTPRSSSTTRSATTSSPATSASSRC